MQDVRSRSAHLRAGGEVLPHKGSSPPPGPASNGPPTASGRRGPASSAACSTTSASRRRPGRHLRVEHRPPPRAVLRRTVHRSGAAHAQHPPVPRAAHLHRQPRRRRGDLRRPSLLGLLAPLLPTFEPAASRDDGRRQGRHPRRPQRSRTARLRGAARRCRPVEFGVDDEHRAASMCYTSGTTGNPKGVVYTHRSTFLHTMGAMTVDSLGARESDVILPVVPMFHANAWGLAHAAVATGADLVMPGPDLSGPAIADLIVNEKVTVAAGVPDDLDGGAARAEGPRHLVAALASRAAARPCRRRCRRPTASRPACRSSRRGG
jgi:hypothetical protein